jgi:hypothetical protein
MYENRNPNTSVIFIYPRGNCIESTTCDNVNGTYTLVSVPATSKCASTENCKPNSSGEYECIKLSSGTRKIGNKLFIPCSFILQLFRLNTPRLS